MPKALTITRDEHTAAELREAAARSNDADATRRMLALALVLEGYQRGEASKLCGMDRQTLRDWVIRYNAEGIAGLCNRRAAGPKPRLAPEQQAAVAELVRKGPDLAKDGAVRWRRVDLARVIKTRFNITLAERSVGAMLRRLGFRRLSVRLRVPGNISLLHLPFYSPELNPVENIWQFLRQNHLSNRIFKTYTDILDACCSAWNALIEEPKRIASIATRDWASVIP